MTSHPEGSSAAWFCLRTHSKHEHIAADWLQRQLAIETYAPRIRFRRAQPRGLVWFTEALFPNYLFARFVLSKSLSKVESAPGIRRVVRFGDHCPSVPDEVIRSLQATVGTEEIRLVDHEVNPGETVQLAGGPFHGLHAVVTRVIPGRQRVAVLLDFLGRQSVVELAAGSVAHLEDERCRVLRRQL